MITFFTISHFERCEQVTAVSLIHKSDVRLFYRKIHMYDGHLAGISCLRFPCSTPTFSGSGEKWFRLPAVWFSPLQPLHGQNYIHRTRLWLHVLVGTPANNSTHSTSGRLVPTLSLKLNLTLILTLILSLLNPANPNRDSKTVKLTCFWPIRSQHHPNDAIFANTLCTSRTIHRVKWRHISVVAMRLPFCRSTRRTVCS